MSKKIRALERRIRREARAWHVIFQSLHHPSKGVWELNQGPYARGYEKLKTALGTEKEVKLHARAAAEIYSVKKWMCVPMLNYNHHYKGHFEWPAIPNWFLIKV